MFSVITITLVILLVTQARSVLSNYTDCVQSSGTVICKHQFPNNLPSNVSKIVVRDYLNSTIDDLVFNGTNWDSVTSTDISVNTAIHFSLKEGNFFHLRKRLSYLGIHAPKLTVIDTYSFKGLANLRILNLSNSVYLNGTQLVTALLESKLELIELNLCYISTARPLELDQTFINMISATKLERLILSGSFFMLKGPLDCSNMTFKLVHLDISNTSFSVLNLDLHNEVKAMTLLLKHLRTLDISYIASRALELNYKFLQNNIFIYNCSEHKFLEIMYKTQNLFLNGIFKSKIYGYNFVFDISACNVHLKSLHLKKNNITYLDVVVRWPENNDFEFIDLSYNGMEYLNNTFFIGLGHLETLDLSFNKLHVMENSNAFSSLLSIFPELRHINLSHNKLKFIPEQMFIKNTEMITLDVSNNALTSITFDVHQFKGIKEIILRNNRIIYLQRTEFMKLNPLIHRRFPTDIDMSQNPFHCTCKSSKFLRWMVSKLQPQTNRIYKCYQDGKTLSIDNETVEKSKYLCKIPGIIIGWTSGSVVVVSSIFIVATVSFKKYRNKTIKRTRYHFINELDRGTFSQKYLCFLTFSSNEDTNLIINVSSLIDQNLQLLTGINHRSLICTGDRNFRPGYSVINEVYRLVDESFIMVCLVSNRFCSSSWCELEMRIATERNKPIILLFTEDVQRLEMPDIMQNIFDTQTRGRIIRENDTYMLVPGIDVLGESIFSLAIKNHQMLESVRGQV